MSRRRVVAVITEAGDALLGELGMSGASAALPVGSDASEAAGSRVTNAGETLWAMTQAWQVSLMNLEDANPLIPDSSPIHPGELVFHS